MPRAKTEPSRADASATRAPHLSRVARDPRNPAITLVKVRAGSSFRLATRDADALHLREGVAVDTELLVALTAAHQYLRLRTLAMGWVNRAALSRAVLEKKAEAKGFEHTLVARLLAEFGGLGLIDDARLAHSGAEAIVSRKPAGESLIVARLTRRGIDEDTARGAAESTLSTRDLRADAIELVRKKVGQRASAMNNPTNRRRLLGLLARRGFDEDLARDAVDEVLGRAEEEGS